MNTRALATQAIYTVLHQKKSLSECLAFYKSRAKTVQDKAFLQALVFGVIRWYPTLEWMIQQLLDKPIKAKNNEVQYLIAVGLYQLHFMRVSDYAVLSETVEAARLLKKPFATGLINAVLRSYQRQSTTLFQTLHKNEMAYYAHPLWFIEQLKQNWPQHWTSILNANNAPPPFSLRVNKQQITRDNYLKQLADNGLNATPIIETETGITLETPIEVDALPGFKDGLCSVQDGAAQLCADFLVLEPRLRVLDACAAPGGKTAHMLEKEPFLAELVAVEVVPERTKRITENLNRLKLKCTLITNDATQPNIWWDGVLFDRILCDAPCSASGVVRRHPDIKFLKKPEDLDRLSEQQLTLLNALWPLLKPGGILLYATCSVFKQENDMTIEQFLKKTDNAMIDKIECASGVSTPFGLQLLPEEAGMDGFYYARLRKKAA